MAYDTTDKHTAHVIASDNLRKPAVMAYLESRAEIVAGTVFKLSQTSGNDMVRLNACKDILDRSGYKPIEQHHSTKEVVFSLSGLFNKAQDIKQLPTINAQRVIKAKVIRQEIKQEASKVKG